MSNSPLVSHTCLSPNSSARTQKITKITPHYMAGNLTVETCGSVFAPSSRQASSNYGIGSDGRVGMYVEESRRAWTSSSSWNDQRAVTIEVANIDTYGTITQAAWDSLVALCVDICRRNGIPKLEFTGNQNGSLTWHCMFVSTSCPGNYIKDNTPRLVAEVNAKLNGDDDMPLTDQDVEKIADRLPAKIWEYVWPQDSNRENQYNRLASVASGMGTLLARVATELPVSVIGTTLYRLINTSTGAHRYVTTPGERDQLVKQGWTEETSIGKLPGGTAIYDVDNPYTGDCILTTDVNEIRSLTSSGWINNGIIGLAGNGAEIHRLRNTYNGMHLFTDSPSEVSDLKSAGYTDEGVAFRAN